MCGIVGVVANPGERASETICDAMAMIQHRGQDSAGIATCDENNRMHLKKDNGLLRDVIRGNDLDHLPGNMGIGHVRYPTAGSSSTTEAQPFYVNSPYGIVMAHNGNLVNTEELTAELFNNDLRHLNTGSDSEVLLNIFAHGLYERGKVTLETDVIFAAVEELHQRCIGAYSCVGLIVGAGVIAFRDPYGIRPLCYGTRKGKLGTEYMFASESLALDALGFTLERDLYPGEAMFVDSKGVCYSKQCTQHPVQRPCIFEYVYLARPDSIMEGVSVYAARLKMGKYLARKITQAVEQYDIDVVIPIPDTSRTSALPIAEELKVNYREGFIKNRYIGRTFIMPGQNQRKKSVRQKLNPIRSEFEAKNVLLVDDSIVRGNTSKRIVELAREAGANKVYLASAAPPIRYPNVYGIDMPASYELIAYKRNVDQICKEIRADGMIYQELGDLEAAVREENPELERFDTSCFDGEYATGGVSPEYLEKIERMRNDEAKSGNMDLHLEFPTQRRII